MIPNNSQNLSVADYNKLVQEHDQKVRLSAQKEAKQLKSLLAPKEIKITDQSTIDRLYTVHVAIAIGKVTISECGFNEKDISKLNQLFPHLPLKI